MGTIIKKKLLPPEIEQRFKNDAAAGLAARRAGNFPLAEEKYLAAWAHVPEPKMDYQVSQTVSWAMVEFYMELRQFDKARRWLDSAYAAYGNDREDVSLNFLEGRLAFEADDRDRAFELFDGAYKRYKLRPFQGYPERYVAFYRERAGKNKAPKKK